MQQKSITPTDYFFRVFPATAGGFLGAGIFLVFFMLLQMPATENMDNTTFSTFAILAISFAGAVSANVLAMLFLSMANAEKYPHRRVLLTNSFLSTLMLFLVAVPFLITSEKSLGITNMLFIFSATVSAVFAELFKDRFSLGGVYGALLAGFLLMISFSKIFESGDEMLLAILLFALPLTWFTVETMAVLGEVILNVFQNNTTPSINNQDNTGSET